MKVLLINAYKNKNKIETLYNFTKKHSKIILADVENIPEKGYDAVIISGSEKLIAIGEYDKPIISFITKNEKPILGICYGHQIIAYAFGGVIKDSGKTLKKKIYVKINREEKIFEDLPEWIYVAESHKEYVDKSSIKDKFHIIASSHYTEVEGIIHKDMPIVGLQFHIERSGEIGEKILQNFLKLMQG